ncbi:MAG TPA: wax ester/triacylglycerol synthase domain-containing protein [Solirubrobacteraceae bacterium]|nr:wax ester/triacylglycerol synthase domain-containing protein [Solirubrobacteraceae bacterium]
MSSARISTLDSLLLSAEQHGDYAHLGWVAVFSAPDGVPQGLFEALAKRIGERIERAPQLRWKLATVPLGLQRAQWVEDAHFSVERHLFRAPGALAPMIDEIFSIPLRRDRPLWELWLCEEPEHGRFALIGKVHRCVLAGSGAEQLRAVVLDNARARGRARGKGGAVGSEASAERLLLSGLRDLADENLRLARRSLGALRSPLKSARGGALALRGGLRGARGLIESGRRGKAPRIRSSLRSLLVGERSRGDLETVARACGTTETEVFLAALAGALHRQTPRADAHPLEALLVSERPERRGPSRAALRTRATVLELPTDEAHALARLYRVREQMSRYARWSRLEAESLLLKIAALLPPPLRPGQESVVAGARPAEVLVVELPGPERSAAVLGCPLMHFHPIAPLTAGHELSVALTRINGSIAYSIHSDRAASPRARAVAASIERSLDELHEDAQALLAVRKKSN